MNIPADVLATIDQQITAYDRMVGGLTEAIHADFGRGASRQMLTAMAIKGLSAARSARPEVLIIHMGVGLVYGAIRDQEVADLRGRVAVLTAKVAELTEAKLRNGEST